MKSRILIFILALFPFAALPAEETETAPADKSSTPAITPDPTANPDILKLKLIPLTVGELHDEAKHWQAAVKASAEIVAEAAVRSAEAESDSEAKQSALDDLAKARESERTLLVNFEVVLAEWEAKGGDAAELRLYAASLSATKVDIKDPNALLDALNRWIKSESGALKWAVKIAAALMILLVARFLSRFIERLVNKAMAGHKASSELLDRFVEKIIRRIIFAIGALVALATLGVQIAPVLALLGGGAFIFAFALQDTLSNFANGIMLLIYQPFDVGDAVEVGGISGSVDSVSLVSTTIRTFDNKIVLVPNKNVWGQTITNINAAGERRVDMIFGIGYDDDIEKAQAILEKIVSETEGVLEVPATTIKMHELADSSVNFICRPWARSADYWSVHWAVTKRVKEEFDAAGISIPYPQQDIHIHQTD